MHRGRGEREGFPPPEALGVAKTRATTPESSTLENRKTAFTQYIEQRVLAGFNAEKMLDGEDLSDIKQYIDNLKPKEKVEALYGEIVIYSELMDTMSKKEVPEDFEADNEPEPAMRPDNEPEPNEPPAHESTQSGESEPIDPLLLARLSLLWADTATREAFLSRYTESRHADSRVRVSAVGQEYHRLSRDHKKLTARFETIERDLFTGSISRADKVRSAKLTAERLVNAKHTIETKLTDIATLKDLPATAENVNLAASLMFDTIARYSDEAKSTHGFIWLPYFKEILRRGVEGMQNGRWPLLIGESGTGKSEVAEAIIRRLSGTDPVMVACTPRLSEIDLVKRQEGGGVDTYGSFMQAATGFDRSDQDKPTHTTGRIVRLDEFLRLGEKAFAVLKRARQLRSGTTYEDGKKVLSGFGAIGTSNPAGRRYPENRPMDAAFEREFAVIRSDFPPMTNANPELYEGLLGALLDDHRHTDIHPAELAPHYRTDESEKGRILKEKITDPLTGTETERELGRIVSRELLDNDPTNPAHGVLWRFTHCVRAIQDAYTLGNANPSDPIPESALKFNVLPDGTLAFDPNGSETLRLDRATMTLEIKSWMTGWRERKSKDSPAARIETFTKWLEYKLGQYIESLSDETDREKIKALAHHFHLTDAPRELPPSTPLIPLEIGKLSPRVPRPYQIEAASVALPIDNQPTLKPRELKTYTTDVVVMDNGNEVNLSRDPSAGFEFTQDGKLIQVHIGSTFTLEGERLIFAGRVDDPGHPLDTQLLVEIAQEKGIHRSITKEAIIEKAKDFDMVFIVPDATNPYREALLEAGVPDTPRTEATAEKKEITLNISEEIRRQTALYADVKDTDGKQLLQMWVDDIESGEHLIIADVSKEYEKITKRITIGMIPVVMPGRSVQEATWEVALTQLKPVWRENEAKKEVNDSYLYEEFKKQKMNQTGFFKNIPDHPYLVWTKPSQQPDNETCNKTFDDQAAYYATMVKDNPDLYDPTDLIPTEYIALQGTFTHAVYEKFQQEQGDETAKPHTLKPLDYATFTRFLSAGAFSVGGVPLAYFYPHSADRRVGFGGGDSGAFGKYGFRPAARSKV